MSILNRSSPTCDESRAAQGQIAIACCCALPSKNKKEGNRVNESLSTAAATSPVRVRLAFKQSIDAGADAAG